MGTACPRCGKQFQRLAMHWQRSACERVGFTDSQLEHVRGLLMGDADIHGRNDPNPLFRLRMTNERFLHYVDELFGILSKGVSLERTATEMAKQAMENQANGVQGFESVNPSNYSSLYGLRTMSHPDLREFNQWYCSAGKRYPEDLSLTPELCRMWYVCDGWLATDSTSTDRPRVMFKCTNERERQPFLTGLFDEEGFDAGFSRDSIQVSAHDTEQLLSWMGPAPPGFEYKWAYED